MPVAVICTLEMGGGFTCHGAMMGGGLIIIIYYVYMMVMDGGLICAVLMSEGLIRTMVP